MILVRLPEKVSAIVLCAYQYEKNLLTTVGIDEMPREQIQS